MLRESLIVKIAIFGSIIGLIILLLYPEQSECAWKKIGEINKDKLGEKVSVFGRIRELKQSETTINFELFDGNRLNAVLFNPKAEDFSLIQKEDLIVVCGTISKYKGKIEIIVESFKVV